MRTNALVRSAKAVGLWGLVLLALPNCTLDRSGIVSIQNLDKGNAPWAGGIFCEIPKPAPVCASTLTEEQLQSAIRLSEAAIALVEGRFSNIAIDDSAAAIAACGEPGRAVFFEGQFPDGLAVCLNCGVIGPVTDGGPLYEDANVACRKRCYDFYGDSLSTPGLFSPSVPPVPAVQAFCDTNAKVATNLSTSCLEGICNGSTLADTYVEGRRQSESVVWAETIDTTTGGALGNDLVRTTPFSGDFDAGAASAQRITHGDGFVEFSVGATNQALGIGLTECTEPCSDSNPAVLGITFGIALNFDGLVYIMERGAFLPTDFGPYSPGERIRVRVRQTPAGGTIFYERVVGACVPGTVCNVTPIHTSTSTPAAYPLRVDASIRDEGATLLDVRVVRIR